MEDSAAQIDYLYRSYCNENVFRSTYRRHQLMTVKRKREVSSSSHSDISDSDNSETSNDAIPGLIPGLIHQTPFQTLRVSKTVSKLKQFHLFM